MKFFMSLLSLAFLVSINMSCQRTLELPIRIEENATKTKNIPPKGFFIENRKVPGIALSTISSQRNTTISRNSTQNSTPDPDNGDDPIVLGQQLTNPYTVANMQQAVNVLYGSYYPVNATHLYVRFKPATVEQFIILEDDENLELQDYPMDYEVIQDGDYYQDPAQGTESFQWLYTVVYVGYNFPPGIQKEILDSLYLPEDNLILEDMAESMAGGAQYNSTKIDNSDTVQIQRIDQPTEVFNYTTEECPCEPDQPCPVWPDCGLGGGGGPGNDPKIPRGTIQVQDITTCNFAITPITNVPVRQANVVCKRWFKIDRSYTNDQGEFVSSKKFNNKTKILVKTENHNAKVSKIRGIRLWQILFPVKKQIGVFDEGAMANISYLFTRPSTSTGHDKDLPYWVAVTTHNSIIEYRQYATEFGVGQPPEKLNVLITNWGFNRGTGATPMWNKCSSLYSDFSTFQEFIEFYIAQSTYLLQINLFGYLKNQMDIIIGYAAPDDDYNCRLTSTDLKSIAYHELGHASHYTRAGCDFWQAYRTRIANELITTFGDDPYGDGTETNAGLVAVGEMWGNHCEKWFSERHYSTPLRETFSTLQGTYLNDGSTFTPYPGAGINTVAGLNANFAAIENFNPNLATDPHNWIPKGICYDLFDNRNDNLLNPVFPQDQVSGYTIQQCFNALQSDVRTIPDFRNRLLLQNLNSQQLQINALFNAYNY